MNSPPMSSAIRDQISSFLLSKNRCMGVCGHFCIFTEPIRIAEYCVQIGSKTSYSLHALPLFGGAQGQLIYEALL